MTGRLVTAAGDPLRAVAATWPELGAWIGRMPVVVHAYPASLGAFPSAVLVETHLKPTNVARGLQLAAELGATACLVAQPLVAADLLLQALRVLRTAPKRLLFALGGYECPASLEHGLLAIAADAGIEARVLHAYGTAEIAAAALVGLRGPDGTLLYRKCIDEVEVETTSAGALSLRLGATAVATGDSCQRLEDGYRVAPGPSRLAVEFAMELSRWGRADWLRRTGHLRRTADGFAVQLRAGVAAQGDEEVEFFDFCRAFGMSWLDKPRWR